MRKLMLTLLAILMIALLFTLSTPVHAGPPEDAAGLWLYIPTVVDSEEAGCHTFLTTTEDAKWTGTFNGASTEAGRVAILCSGWWYFNAIVTFDDVTVIDESGDQRSGSLKMIAFGKRPNETADWAGQWRIIRGTDELANLHGQGTFDGPGYLDSAPEEYGVINYEGEYYFEPN